ncbi:hypothetical protein AB0O64_23460 [Streptomyces sp. NPDC088341]|uniref:hypothetical protein n=1 Tax=Streptomyces sp. NPDC088341 TaxID=3154870 RepID=UPI003445023F
MPRPQPADLWAELNPRQQIYLTVIYYADQNAEANQKGGAYDWGQGPPASEWRWQTFSVKAPKEVAGRTAIQYALAQKNEHDQGAGSSLAALRRRELIEVMDDWVQTMLGMVPRVRVKLTTLGRATARAGLGHTAPKSPPRGLLSEWLWSNLVRLYRAGPDGMPTDSPHGTPPEERAPSDKARFFLERDQRRPGGSLIMSKRVPVGEPYESHMYPGVMNQRTEYRVYLSEAGQAHYEQHVRCYAELWPDIDAPVPENLPEEAHRSLDDHKVRKPRGLLTRAPFLLLVALVRNDINDRLWIRKEWTMYWKNFGSEPPEGLLALPAGITTNQIRSITRSTTAAAKLLEFRSGSLAAEKEIHHWLYPPRRLWSDGSSIWPDDLKVLHITEAGRAHYAANLEAYRAAYDDVEAPDAPEAWTAAPPAEAAPSDG